MSRFEKFRGSRFGSSRFSLRGFSGFDLAEQIITVASGGTSPTLGALADGDQVQDALSAGALDTGNYELTAGRITDVSATVTINGSPGALADVVGFEDVVSVEITVTDSVGNTRDFRAGIQAVAGIDPTIAASDSLSGRTLTITVDSTTGAPAPSTSLTALTLDGVDVLGDETGSGPWTYEVPDSVNQQSVGWTLTATNAAGNATAAGITVVASNLVAAPITADTDSALSMIWVGGTLSDSTAWGAYQSSGGNIVTPTTKEMSVNGGAAVAYDGAATLVDGDTYQLIETVSDDVGNTREFVTATQTVQPDAPAFGPLSPITLGRLTTTSSIIGQLLPDDVGEGTNWDPSGGLEDVVVFATVEDVAGGQSASVRVQVIGGSDGLVNFYTGTRFVAGPSTGLVVAPELSGVPLPGATVTVNPGNYASVDYSASGELRLNAMPIYAYTALAAGASFEYAIPYTAEEGDTLTFEETSASGITNQTQVTIVRADPSIVPDFSLVWNGTDAFVASNAEFTLEID